MISAEYLAGFFDGEGCVSFQINKRNGKLRDGKHSTRVNASIHIAGTHLPTLRAIQLEWGGRLHAHRKDLDSGMQRIRQCWALWWSRQLEVVRVMRAIQPYVLVKKDQIDFFMSEYVPTMLVNTGTYFLSDEQYAKRFEVRDMLSKMKRIEFVS